VDLTIKSSPTQYEGETWYKVEQTGPTLGCKRDRMVWVKAAALDSGTRDFEADPGSKFRCNFELTVMEETTAWQDGQQVTVQRGTIGEFTDGPFKYDNVTWYKIETLTESYWVPEGDLAEGERLEVTPTATPTPTSEFVAGQPVRVASQATAYRGSQTVQVEPGLSGTITKGPTDYEGQIWYKIDAGDSTYWIPVTALDADGDYTVTPTPRPEFRTREAVVVTNNTTVWKGDDKTRLTADHIGDVIKGPTEYEGRIWYKVRVRTHRKDGPAFEPKEGRFWIPKAVLESHGNYRDSRRNP
jgi:hypothetical protein